jgi:hypothetical protein
VQLGDLIVASATAAIPLQQRDGSFPAGRNGPYQDLETPVRNTAHWLVTLLGAHARSGSPRLREAAGRAATYLASAAVRPHGATFLCRTNPFKDSCNGLIGQAWVIEALNDAAHALGDERYGELAREVFCLHPFDSERGLWRVVDVDGRAERTDPTFNHQLWFAAAGARLDPSPTGTIGSRVHRFLDGVPAHLRVARSGRIRHYIAPVQSPPTFDDRGRWRDALPTPVRAAVRRARGLGRSLKGWRARVHLIRREVGYHAFNLYGFALIRERVAAHALWESRQLRAALRYLGRPAFGLGLERNPYAYPYNAPGFEVAFALQVLGDAGGSAPPDLWWVNRQLARTWDWDAHMMSRGTDDPTTLAARLYQACRLRDLPVRAGAPPRSRPA